MAEDREAAGDLDLAPDAVGDDLNDNDLNDDVLDEDVLDELAAVAEAEVTAEEAEQAVQAEQIAALEREMTAERERTQAAVARYREAVLAAEPDLPEELVSGASLKELEQSLAAARRAVATIRERLTVEEQQGGGFPVGAPARAAASTAGMTAAEKIAFGLEREARSG